MLLMMVFGFCGVLSGTIRRELHGEVVLRRIVGRIGQFLRNRSIAVAFQPIGNPSADRTSLRMPDGLPIRGDLICHEVSTAETLAYNAIGSYRRWPAARPPTLGSVLRRMQSSFRPFFELAVLFRLLIVLIPAAVATQSLAAQQPMFGFGNDPQAFQRTELSPTVYLAEVNGITRAHLKRVDEYLAGQQWDAAVEALMQVSEEDADGLIRVGQEEDEFPVYVRLRRAVNGRFCSLPTSAQPALRSYRQRVDALARRWYEQATSERDGELLGRLVDQMLPSSHGDNALYALGEMALERGHPLAARRYWEQLHPGLRWTTGDRRLSLWSALRGVDLDKAWPQIQDSIE